MSEPLVSVVIPVYNAEKTLARCVDSILQQTYDKWELLLVDDGSTDGSSAICDQYCQKDERITCISKENGGVSSARNVGMTNASGKYICFIDSDDWIEKEALERLLLEAQVSGAGYIIPRMKIVVFNDKGKCVEERYDADEIAFQSSRQSLSSDFLSIMKQGILFSASGRLYSLNYLKTNSIAFPEHVKLLEDFCFNLQCLEKGTSLSHISYVAYNFYVRDISHYAYKRKYADYYLGIREVYQRLQALFCRVGIENNVYYNNFLIGYWGMALSAAEKQENSFVKKSRFQRKVAYEVRRERIMEEYSPELVDRSIRYLIMTGQPIVYQSVRMLQKIKRKIMRG